MGLRIPVDEAVRFTRECFLKAGVPEEDASVIADHLVLANLRGVDSHGIVRIPYYIEGLRKGLVRARAEAKKISEGPSHILLDFGGGIGIPAAVRTTRAAIEKARTSGVGLAGARGLGHVGMLAYYTLMIVEERMIGIAVTNAPSRVAPWGGSEAVFGTNPISIGFPGRRRVVIDMATSSIAHFKIRLAAMRGERIPEGIALDKEGRPTTDPKEAFEGVLLPFGGYKGYALSLAVEMLSSALTGAPASFEIPSHPSTQGGFLVISIDVGAVRGFEEFQESAEKILERVKSSRRAEGFSEILIPGEPEEREERLRRAKGIPVDRETWELLSKVAEELGVDLPRAVETP